MCAPHADFVDVYCDRGAFDLDEAIAILSAGKALGLKIRAHAEQVSHTGIAEAAAQLGATALDHLERIDDAGLLPWLMLGLWPSFCRVRSSTSGMQPPQLKHSEKPVYPSLWVPT